MVRSVRKVLSFVPTIIILHIGAVISVNCNSSSVSFAQPFCSYQGSVGRRVYLSGIDNKTNGIGCSCSISLFSSNQDPGEIDIKNITTSSNPCDYSLYSVYRNNTIKLYSCDEQLHKKSFELKPMETVRLHMETGTYNGVGFPFCLELSADLGSRIQLWCSRPTPQASKTTNTSPKSITSIKSPSTQKIMTTIYDTQNIPTTKPQTNGDDSDRLIGIITGSVVAVLVVSALIIVIVCLVKRRKKDVIYETPQQPQQGSHIYMDLHVEPVNSGTQQNSIYVNSVAI